MLLKKLLLGRIALGLVTFFVGALPLFKLSPSHAMETAIEYPETKYFIGSLSAKGKELKLSFVEFHPLLAGLPEKLTADSDEGIIHNLNILKNETSGMPSYNDFLYCNEQEFYGISIFGYQDGHVLSLSDLLIADFSLSKFDDEKECAFQKKILISNNVPVSTYTAYSLLKIQFDTLYCHFFFLNRPKDVKDDDLFKNVNPVRHASILDFYRLTLLRSVSVVTDSSTSTSVSLQSPRNSSPHSEGSTSLESSLLSNKPINVTNEPQNPINLSESSPPIQNRSRAGSVNWKGLFSTSTDSLSSKLTNGSSHSQGKSAEVLIKRPKGSEKTPSLKMAKSTGSMENVSSISNSNGKDVAPVMFIPKDSSDTGSSLESPKAEDRARENKVKGSKSVPKKEKDKRKK